MATISVLEHARELSAGVEKLYIDGTWCEAGGGMWQHVHPASGERDFTIAVASDEDVDRAVRAARHAFDEGPWPRMRARERKLALQPIGDLIRAHDEELRRLQSLDNGVPLSWGESYKVSPLIGADIFEYHLGWVDKLQGAAPPSFSQHADTQFVTIKEPLGVIASITPFNAPILQFAQKVAPALAAGCTVVLKPSEYASNVTQCYTRLIEQLDLPPGVLNVVNGTGATGAALVRHPLIDKVAFTGRRTIGREVLAQAARGFKRCALELGGKSPSIVFDDVQDLRKTARFAMRAVSMGLSGQVCSTQTRALVHRSIYDDFLEAAHAQLADVCQGDPFDSATTSAPLITPAAAESVLAHIEGALEQGARLIAGGTRPQRDDLSAGNWVEPTLFADVDQRMTIAREELFGPVLSVIPFGSEDEAIRIANDSEYGLSAGVHTGNPSRAFRVARAVRSGTVGINDLFIFAPPATFGGYKTSGLGREGGREGIEEYLETKTITVRLDD